MAFKAVPKPKVQMSLFPDRQHTVGARAELQGTIAREIFRAADTSYAVLELHTEEETVTLVGDLPGVQVGQEITVGGVWTRHRKYGEQLRVQSFQVQQPTSAAGLRAYLGSGVIPGVGMVLAERIVAHWGEQTLAMLQQAVSNPRLLEAISGIGPKLAPRIATAWGEVEEGREVIIDLQGLGLTPNLAAKVYKEYGAPAGSVVRDNPYQLAEDIWGVGFKTADSVARGIGFPVDSPYRIQAGLTHVLREAAQREGHLFLPQGELVRRAAELLEVAEEAVRGEVAPLHERGRVYVDATFAAAGEAAVYERGYYYDEVLLARALRAVAEGPRNPKFAAAEWAQLEPRLPRVGDGDEELNAEQRAAVQAVLQHKITVVTGGPGTGKTTMTQAVLVVCDILGAHSRLLAPTGMAAKRLGVLGGGRESSTIHRGLGFHPGGEPEYNGDMPFPEDLVIVDETSMLDVPLARLLAAAIHPAAHVLFVGDVDQLESVGPGNVLRDLIASGCAEVVYLRENYRLRAGSTIVANALRVRDGAMPDLSGHEDFRFVPATSQEEAARIVEQLVLQITQRGTAEGGAPEPVVLIPMRRGEAGVTAMNRRLQEALNPARGQAEITTGAGLLREGDRVMQTRNNYQLRVFNGEQGRVRMVVVADQQVVVEIEEEQRVTYEGELSQLELAYVLTVHKSQGSEYDVVIVVLLASHYPLLARNLLYTALTRARQRVVLVGEKRAVAIAVGNAKVAQRYSWLRQRLAAEVQGAAGEATSKFGSSRELEQAAVVRR